MIPGYVSKLGRAKKNIRRRSYLVLVCPGIGEVPDVIIQPVMNQVTEAQVALLQR